MQLVIPFAAVTNISAGSYVLTVTVTNAFNKSATDNHAFTKQATATAPTVLIDQGPATFSPSTGLRLYGRVLASSVCGGASGAPVYSWSTNLTSVAATLATVTTPMLLLRGPISGTSPSATYSFTLTASFAGSSAKSTATATIKQEPSALLPNLAGPCGDVRQSATAVFSAAGSYDPDDPNNAVLPMSYSWSCQAPDLLGCFSNSSYAGVQQGATWSIDLSQVSTSCGPLGRGSLGCVDRWGNRYLGPWR